MEPQIAAQARIQSSFCRVFGNPLRVMILWHLAGQAEMHVGEIAANIGTSMQNTSQHLRLMRDRGILESRRAGKEIYYRIAENERMRTCLLFRFNPLGEQVGQEEIGNWAENTNQV